MRSRKELIRIMHRRYEQPTKRDDPRSTYTNQGGKSQTLDVRASSQRLKDEQEARPPDSKGKSIASPLSASRKETALSLHDQSSDPKQDLGASTRDLAKRVGGASTRDLARRVVDANNRSNQVKSQTRKSTLFTAFKKLKIKRLMDIFRMCRSRTSEVQWPSNEQRQYRLSSSNSKRSIGSKDRAASSSADWANKAEEASNSKYASKKKIKQLTREKSNLSEDLQENKNKLSHSRSHIEMKKLQSSIRLERSKMRFARIREQISEIVSKAAKSIESKQ
jgi:hypothetical protein